MIDFGKCEVWSDGEWERGQGSRDGKQSFQTSLTPSQAAFFPLPHQHTRRGSLGPHFHLGAHTYHLAEKGSAPGLTVLPGFCQDYALRTRGDILKESWMLQLEGDWREGGQEQKPKGAMSPGACRSDITVRKGPLHASVGPCCPHALAYLSLQPLHSHLHPLKQGSSCLALSQLSTAFRALL